MVALRLPPPFGYPPLLSKNSTIFLYACRSKLLGGGFPVRNSPPVFFCGVVLLPFHFSFFCFSSLNLDLRCK